MGAAAPLRHRLRSAAGGHLPSVDFEARYEVLRGSDASRLLTLTGAHPSARVVHDAAQAAAAEQRLMPSKR